MTDVSYTIQRPITFKVLVDTKVSYSFDTLLDRMTTAVRFYRGLFPNDPIYFTIEQNVNMDTLKWSEASFLLANGQTVKTLTPDSQSVGYTLAPYVHKADICIAWVSPRNWKSLHSISLTLPERILGTTFIATCIPEDHIRPEWADRYDGYTWTGSVIHEIAHALDARCRSFPRPHNNYDYYVKGWDNTHYYDYVLKDLTKKKEEININNFQGYEIPGHTRLFSYQNKPLTKTEPLTWVPLVGKIYRSSDFRMFFEYIGQLKWKSLTEAEFSARMKRGDKWGTISVPEANHIQVHFLGLPIPEYVGKAIIERAVPTHSWEHLWLKLRGWSDDVPNKHL